jgi:hypothetical protein
MDKLPRSIKTKRDSSCLELKNKKKNIMKKSKEINNLENFRTPTMDDFKKSNEHLYKCVPRKSLIIEMLFGSVELTKGETCYYRYNERRYHVDLYTQLNKTRPMDLLLEEFIEDFLID